MKEGKRKLRKIAFFGNFGQGNLGNESTLQAILYHLRRYIPDAEVTCICTGPELTATTYNIAAVPMKDILVRTGPVRNDPLTRFLRRLFIGIPSELYRWVKAFRTLKGTDMFIKPGTQFLSDHLTGPFGWPYLAFKWSVTAKIRRCKLAFVSVGVGPLHHPLSRFFVKSALFLADYRSYRDEFSKKYLENMGFKTNNDRVYPDLAFSLPVTIVPECKNRDGHRCVVGLGLKDYYGQDDIPRSNDEAMYSDYINKLGTFVTWLIEHKYTVRVLIGDVYYDSRVKQDLRELLEKRQLKYEDGQIIDEAICSVEELLLQLETTDVVVSPRYHNILLALMLKKPVIALSYHEQKFIPLMTGVGLAKYCQHIDHLDVDKLIQQFIEIQKNAHTLKPYIKEKTEEYRNALDEQYNIIFSDV